MSSSTAAVTRTRGPSRGRFALALLAGALVALSLGIYGRVHDPTGESLVTLFFTRTITLKVWLATGAVALAVVQLLSALRMYGKLGRGTGPRWLRTSHRIGGTGAFLLAIPVAYHCLWALGFQYQAGTRVLLHGVFGCLFFGTLATKVLVVENRKMPRWALPVIGGVLFTVLVLVWATSALWFFRTQGLHL
jgi:Family of unknown function (DUF6529)